ncbi:MAG: energy transducer TonB [Flavobacteriales bacterium]|nr:energy transducer TonB [Flavobacteriales bacterium]
MIDIPNTGDKRVALIISVVVHALILLWLLFMIKFVVPDPPLGERSVMLTMKDFGFDSQGSGAVESESPTEEETVEETAQTTPTQTETATEEVVTQETSETQVESSTAETTSESTTQQQEVSSELNNILDQINNNGGGGDGSSSTPGNEGTEDGEIDGKGIFDGGGWELSGRGIIGYPTLNDAVTEEGIVVLNIYVDRNGNVIDTQRNYSLSNTSSDKLFKLAEKAAKTAKFNVKPNAPPKQKGVMTFKFELN